jgi:hypothetical protein
VKTSDSIKEIATALAKAQSVMAGAKKDATNPHFRSKYADLASVWEACRSPLATNGIAVIQMTEPSDKDEIIVDTRLMHTSGEWIEGRLVLPVSKADAQGYGSALTYARRYGLSAAVGIAPEDDDGNAAAAAKPDYSKHTARQVAVDELEAQSPEEQAFLREKAIEIIAVHESKGDVFAFVETQHFDTEQKLALWSLLPSNVRSAIKRARAPNGLASQP